jgi:hypothetical protein
LFVLLGTYYSVYQIKEDGWAGYVAHMKRRTKDRVVLGKPEGKGLHRWEDITDTGRCGFGWVHLA